jgi:hypothetical protein
VQRNTVQDNPLNVSKQNGYGGGASQGIQPNGLHSMTGHRKADISEGDRSFFAAKQASLENEIKQLKKQLSDNSEKETETKRRLEGMSESNLKYSVFEKRGNHHRIFIFSYILYFSDEHKRNELLQQQLNELNVSKERVCCFKTGYILELQCAYHSFTNYLCIFIFLYYYCSHAAPCIFIYA